RRLARRGASAAAPVAKSVFDVIDIVGMAGPIGGGDPGIVLRALVDIVDGECDRRARRAPALDAGEDADPVRLRAHRREARLARAAAIEERLDVAFAERDSGRTALDERADRRPVALAPGREAEDPPEAVPAHPAACMARAGASGKGS